MNKFRLTVLPLALLIAACGGTGGADTDSGGVDVNRVYRAVLDGGLAYTVRGELYNEEAFRVDIFEATHTYAPRTSTTSAIAPGNWQSQRTESGKFVSSPFPPFVGSPEFTYTDAEYTIKGYTTSNGCTLARHIAFPPRSASMGSSGVIAEAIPGSSCSPTSAAGLLSFTTNWSVVSEGGFTFVCFTVSSFAANGVSFGSGSRCFEHASGGGLGTRYFVRYSDGTGPIILRNFIPR